MIRTRRLASPRSRSALAVLSGAIAPAGQPPTAQPTAAEADAFVAEAEKTLADAVDRLATSIAWVNATYITDDTDALAAQGRRGGDRAAGAAMRSRRRKYQTGRRAVARYASASST